MADLFSNISTTPSPLEQVDLTQPAPETNINNQTAGRTARLGAIATSDLGSTDPTYLKSLNDTTAALKQQISEYGDASIRNQVAASTQAERVRQFSNIMANTDESADPDGSLRQGAALASQAVLQESLDQKAKYALEEKSLEQIQDMAGSDPVQAQILKHNLLDGDTNQVIRDFSAKQLILQREIENSGVKVENQSWFADLADFAMGTAQNLIPFTRGDIGNVDGVTKSWYDTLFSGERKQREAGSLWNMPVSDFSTFVHDHLIPNLQRSSTFLGYHNQSEDLGTLTSLAHPGSVQNQNILDGVNNIGLVAGFRGPLMKVVSLPSLMIRQGARDAAVSTIEGAMHIAATEGAEAATAKSGMTSEEIISSASPSAVNPGAPVSKVPVAGDVNLAYARGEALMNSIPDLQQPGRFMTDAEKADVFQKNFNSITEQFGRNALVKDVMPIEERLSTGQTITHLEVTLGSPVKGGFASQEEAEEFANSLNLPSGSINEVPYPRVEPTDEDKVALDRLDWESTRDDSGQWFIKFKMPMKETGFYSNPLAPQATNIISRFFLNARKVSDSWLQDLAQVSGNTRQRIGAALSDKVKRINSLSQNELSSLGQVLQHGINNKTWLTEDELRVMYRRAFNREPSVKELGAYQDYRDLNDMEFTLRTDNAYAQLHLKGYRTVSVRGKNVGLDNLNAVIDRSPTAVPRERVYDAFNDTHYTSQNPLTQSELDRLRGQGLRLVKLEHPQKLNDGTWVKNFLVKDSDLDEQPLVRHQVGYSPGGHRIYSGKGFVKQARTIKQPDTKTEQFVNPHTYINGETRGELLPWVETMNQARVAVRSGVGAHTLDKLFRGRAGFPTGQEFLDGVKDGTYSLEHPFEAVWDRELPSAYLEKGANLEYVDQDRDGINGLLETQGRLYYSPKGESLKDFRGALAPTLDPYKTLNLALQNISKLTSFADYKQAAVERWASSFRKYTSIPSEVSDWRVFKDGVIGRDIPERIRQGAEAQRDVIRRILNHKSELDYQQEQMAHRMADWVVGDGNDKLKNSLAKGVSWWATKDPSSSIRGLIFDAKMGFWNPVQVPIHLGNMYAALTLGGPKKGMAAFMNLWHMSPFLTRKTPELEEQFLDHVVSQGTHSKLGFSTADEFKTMYRYVKTSGMMNIGDSNALLNEFGPNASISAFSNGAERVRESGRMLLHWTWLKNKQAAASLAWQDLREAFPHMDYHSQEFLNKFAGRTEEYDLNFSRESRAAWQKGWTAIPTQFFGYWTALADAAFGKQFTPAARARLVLGQLFLAGSAGIPVVSVLDSYYSSEHAGDPNGLPRPDNFWGGLRRGALDEIIYQATGADVKAGARMGVGDEFTNVVQEIFGFGENGDKTMADVFGGASYSVVTAMGKSMTDLVKHVAMQGGNDTLSPRDSVLRVASQVNTMGNVIKAYSIFKYGTLKASNGTVLADDVPTAEGWAQAIGFQPESQVYLSSMMAYAKDQSQVVKDASKMIEKYRTRWATEVDNRDEITQDLNTFMKLLPPDVKLKAIKAAGRNTETSVYKSIGDSIKRDLQQKQIIEQLEDQQ